MTASIDIRQLSVQFTGNHATMTAIEHLSLRVAPGEFVAIVGPSGCGKSTLLRVIAGLVAASGGEVRINGVPVSEPPPGVGFMFQRDTLLPWATVAENIKVGCELSAMAPADYPRRVAELIELVKLHGFEGHYPSALSGGMRQRVSLARLLAYEPQLYLMDEPFGALDYQTKIVMGRELLRIWESRRRSIVFVTHDIEEAVALADRVIVMSPRPGRIVQDYRIDLPRPREPRALRGNPEFSRLCAAIWADLAQASGEALA
ncbi:NitT/TauT family transport system ATP-binding protein [Raoultella sp. BIGb0138]|uniref:ABC transporter ATP-binding protein n=1 Tax=Raoultella sp. BIGb0138 TaxID=2485115 RepID=UPI0010540EA1|nr:ABC transporter ATP-binding protein [Raoultella sp. BIGb0138]TCW17624.1 NitT/TauT family transport system ATP-binding protein [Raoultella sp. BIGb0138]